MLGPRKFWPELPEPSSFFEREVDVRKGCWAVQRLLYCFERELQAVWKEGWELIVREGCWAVQGLLSCFERV